MILTLVVQNINGVRKFVNILCFAGFVKFNTQKGERKREAVWMNVIQKKVIERV